MKLFKAEYESRNFSFEAYGTTEEEARKTLIAGLRKHGRQYRCDKNWFYPDSIGVTQIEVGKAYRDHSDIDEGDE